MSRRRDILACVHTEGPILPLHLLARVVARRPDLPGLKDEEYGLESGKKLSEAINAAWNTLQGRWRAFQAERSQVAANDPAVALTRERWLIPLFAELGYRGLSANRSSLTVGEFVCPLSHQWQAKPEGSLRTPIHLLECGVDLDRRSSGVVGASQGSPHSLIQQLLNQAQHDRAGSRWGLWGFVTNGLRLRVLRENASLTRQAFVEFDLEALMEGGEGCYSDFALLFLLCHRTRVEGTSPEAAWLEKWSRLAQSEGVRALDDLRGGVERAIAILGRGFLECRENQGVRERLRAGHLSTRDYMRQLLRLVYRLLFLFAAEDRGLLLDPNADTAARERYQKYYSTARLRALAQRRRGSRHPDLYRMLRMIMDFLDSGSGDLGLCPMGSFLWSREAIPDLVDCDLGNQHLLDAIRAIAWREEGRVLRAVDYRNLGAEELGSVYESLLELEPVLDADARTFEFTSSGVHERKATGSYYTPTNLIQCLLNASLDPLLDQASRSASPAQAILSLKICDPACGSGHFLIAAAHRMARRLASARTGEVEASSAVVRQAVRDVIAHCIYGVDLNDMAVELCKVNLWMETLVPGLPLAFLDHRILCGNSILGATPAQIKAGIPDEAFKTGGPKDGLTVLRRQNRRERQERGQALLWADSPTMGDWEAVETRFRQLEAIDDTSAGGLNEKKLNLAELQVSAEYRHHRRVADAWCAAFAWDRTEPANRALTDHAFARLKNSPGSSPADLSDEVDRLSRQHGFHHWHLAFPDVFRLPGPGEAPENEETGWSGGFDLVLGNPPYLRDSRKKDLPADLLALYRSATSHYDIYVLFMELALKIARPGGVVSLVTSNGYLRQKYGAGIQEILLAHRLDLLLEIDYNAFTAGVKTCITSVRRQPSHPSDIVRMARVTSSEELDDLVTTGKGSLEKPQSWLKDQKTFSIPRAPVAGDQLPMSAHESTIPLEEIALVSLGMVFNEPRPGGKKKKDYLSSIRVEPFTTALVDGEHVERWGVNGKIWLHHCPREHREPRFAELFGSPKILCRRIIGKSRPMAFVDDDSLYFSDNVVGVIPLHQVQGGTARILSGYTPEQYEKSKAFSVYYLACLLNSRAFEAYARQVLGVGLHLYPGHVRQLPVPCIPLADQEPFIRLAQEAQEIYRACALERPSARSIDAVEAEIEGHVARLYGLDPSQARDGCEPRG